MNENTQSTGFQTILDAEGNFTENWREQECVKTSLGELANDPTIADFKRFPDIVKSFISTKKLVGANTLIPPKEDSPPDVWESYYNAGGRPGSPEQYKLKYDGLEMSDAEKSTWHALFHEIGLNERQAQKLINQVSEGNKQTLQALELAADQERQEALKALRLRYGDTGYDQLVKDKDATLRLFDKKGVFEKLGLLEEPEVIEMLASIGKAIDEDRLVSHTQTSESKSQIEQQIKEFMNHPAFTDASHPQHKATVAKVTELYQKRSA